MNKCIICTDNFYSEGDTCNQCATIMDGKPRTNDRNPKPDLSNTNEQTLLPEQIGCISLEWLEEQIARAFLPAYKAALIGVKNNLFPLTPILEDTWEKGKKNDVMWASGKEYEVLKQTFLSQPIKLEK